MSSLRRLIAALGLCAVAGLAVAIKAEAAEGRLYPSGPPHGVAYLRFANLSPASLKITSLGGALSLPSGDAQRVGEYDPVTPGTELTGTVDIGGKTKPIKLTLTPNEFVTVAITQAEDGGPAIALLREEPTDFNAQKSALALYNLDAGCSEGRLYAVDGLVAVISGVAPGASGRRLVNPVNVALAASCGVQAAGVAVELGAMEAGERYSVFLYAPSGAGRQVLALRDKMAPFRP